MTISDALPVQFWVNGVETYNQKEVCGITPVCFCQPFNSTDEIRIQVQDETGLDLLLKIYDSIDNELQSLSFTEITSGVYEMSFVPSELSVTDEQVRIEIITVELNDTAFNTNWTDQGGGEPWTLGATDLSVQVDNAVSNRVRRSLNFTSGHLYVLNLIFTLGNPDGIRVRIFLGGTQEVYFGEFTTGTPFNESVSVVALADYTYFEIEVDTSFQAANPIDISITDVIIKAILAQSDCLDIKTSHDCTTLIRYDNAKDFAGLEYSSFSPTAEFYLRIPAIFFHERNTEEEESFEESTENIVRLRNEIKLKKLLEVGFMPDYMHRKLLLILAHDTIEIDGESWVKRDPYEKEEPSNKRYPLKKASVLLTQKDYIKRNIL